MALAGFGMASAAMADSFDKRLMRTNVECGGAYVTGFTLIRSEVQQFIGETAAAYCGDEADIARYTVVPASVDIFELDEVVAYLAILGDTDVQPILKKEDTDTRAEVSVSVVAEIPDDPDTEVDEYEPEKEVEVTTYVRTTSRVVNGGW
jgi:hypothetical protein